MAGELSAEAGQAMALHLEACTICRQRHADLAEEQRRFAGDLPACAPLEQPGAVGASGLRWRVRPPGLRWFLGASALAAAAALVLFVARPGQLGTPSVLRSDGFGTRAKGSGASLGWAVRRGEHVFTGSPERALRAGDALRFTISSREPVYVAVLGLDAAGRLSVYHPNADRLTRVEAGQQQPLPSAVELDGTTGDEALYGVFCSSALPLSVVTLAVERSPQDPPLPLGCAFERWKVRKEAQ